MAQVTYRGVKYDSEEYREMLINEHNAKRNHDLMYRGIKVRSKAKACSWNKGGVDPLLFLCYNILMDKDKLKIIVSDLEMLLSALKAEVYSDVESYRYDDVEPVELDYDEEYEGPWQ